MLISGRTGTGKTALVRYLTAGARQDYTFDDVLADTYVLCRDFLISKSVISAWCNCVESQKPQYILQILLAQLKVPRGAHSSNHCKPFTMHARTPDPVLMTRTARGRLGMCIRSIRSSAVRQTSCGSSQVHGLPVEPYNTATVARILTPISTGLAPADGGLKVLVLDNAHRIADQPLLAVLLRLRELTGGSRAATAYPCPTPYQNSL